MGGADENGARAPQNFGFCGAPQTAPLWRCMMAAASVTAYAAAEDGV